MNGLTYLDSPLGKIRISSDEGVVTQIHFLDEPYNLEIEHPSDLTNMAAVQLQEYFVGQRPVFDFPFFQTGTPFQQRVWEALTLIPSGHTISYAILANRLGDAKCIRAAASANGKNNIAIVVPCHRVVGSGGKLVGYAGGLWRKQWLLEHELGMMGGQPGKLF